MDCKAFRQEIELLETGETSRAVAQSHLNACPACRTFQRERLSLRQLVGSLGAVNVPPDFDFRLRARIAAAKGAGPYSLQRTRFAPGLKAISVAASFALLITAAVLFKQFQPARQSASASAPQTAVGAPNDGQLHETASNPERLAKATPDNAGLPVAGPSVPASPGEVSQTGGNNAGKATQVKHTRGPIPAIRERSPVVSNDFALRGNPAVVTRDQQLTTPAANSTDVATLLQVSSAPVRVLLHDKQGAMHSVSLERVVFGSQSFLERAVPRHPPAASAEGIW
jgi:hypothetical protein